MGAPRSLANHFLPDLLRVLCKVPAGGNGQEPLLTANLSVDRNIIKRGINKALVLEYVASGSTSCIAIGAGEPIRAYADLVLTNAPVVASTTRQFQIAVVPCEPFGARALVVLADAPVPAASARFGKLLADVARGTVDALALPADALATVQALVLEKGAPIKFTLRPEEPFRALALAVAARATIQTLGVCTRICWASMYHSALFAYKAPVQAFGPPAIDARDMGAAVRPGTGLEASCRFSNASPVPLLAVFATVLACHFAVAVAPLLAVRDLQLAEGVRAFVPRAVLGVGSGHRRAICRVTRSRVAAAIGRSTIHSERICTGLQAADRVCV